MHTILRCPVIYAQLLQFSESTIVKHILTSHLDIWLTFGLTLTFSLDSVFLRDVYVIVT